ncbi:MAG: hypothetical protein M3209_15055 [Acidobacteriota bacterium]|nr:hypothetical protein [Acidobacteriota bacterium]
MRKLILLLLVTLTSTIIFGQQNNQSNANASQNESKVSNDDLELFTWKNEYVTFGTILLPKGYSVKSRNYDHGTITHFIYPDNSLIVIHRGGMMEIPFFKEPEYIVFENCRKITAPEKRERIIHQTFRRGKIKDKDLYWREENTYIRGMPMTINIGYDKVPKERVELFNKALDSFVEKVPER